MAKKKPASVETKTTDPLVTETKASKASSPTTTTTSAPAPKKVETTPAPPEPKEEPIPEPVTTTRAPKPKAAAAGLDSEVKKHLQIIGEYGSVTVETFRELAGLGTEAVLTLKGYVADGTVDRTWSAAYGRYSLTPKGQALIA